MWQQAGERFSTRMGERINTRVPVWQRRVPIGD